jgi:hypothetical protein
VFAAVLSTMPVRVLFLALLSTECKLASHASVNIFTAVDTFIFIYAGKCGDKLHV